MAVIKVLHTSLLNTTVIAFPDVINVIKMPSFQYFLYLREQKKLTGGE